MLYTSRPLERIYADFIGKERGKPKKDARESAQYREVMLNHGRVVTRREGENYVVEHISSTDMKDYLNESYSPGKTIEDKK